MAEKISMDLSEHEKCSNEKDQRIKLLQEQLESKSKVSMDAENSLRHLSKTLEDLKEGFEGARSHADAVMEDNDKLRHQNQVLT